MGKGLAARHGELALLAYPGWPPRAADLDKAAGCDLIGHLYAQQCHTELTRNPRRSLPLRLRRPRRVSRAAALAERAAAGGTVLLPASRLLAGPGAGLGSRSTAVGAAAAAPGPLARTAARPARPPAPTPAPFRTARARAPRPAPAPSRFHRTARARRPAATRQALCGAHRARAALVRRADVARQHLQGDRLSLCQTGGRGGPGYPSPNSTLSRPTGSARLLHQLQEAVAVRVQRRAPGGRARGGRHRPGRAQLRLGRRRQPHAGRRERLRRRVRADLARGPPRLWSGDS